MKRLSILCLAVVMAVAFSFGSAYAASAKATCGAGDLSVIEFHSAAPIFTQTIHSASQKDLFIDVSLECGLTTNTMVMSKALKRDISEAEASVKVWVMVDDDLAAPGVVTFARRYQALIAEFAGSLSIPDGMVWADCLVTDETTGITTISEECLTEEMLALILDTMSANSFNFMISDLAAGDHEIVVWAELDYNLAGEEFVDTEDELSDWAPEDITTKAYLGKGSVTVESVRMVKEDVVSID